MPVEVPAAHRDPLLSKVGTFVAFAHLCPKEGGREGRLDGALQAGKASPADLEVDVAGHLALLDSPAHSGLPTFFAFCVLQAEAGFVPFGHPGSIKCQEVVVCEDVHAVVVPEMGGPGA